MNIKLRMMARLCRGVIACVLVLALCGCSRSFFVRAVGTADDLVFFFYSDREMVKPDDHKITQLAVKKYGSDGEIVWRIEGPFVADSLKYGATSSEFRTLVEPKPLTADAKYQVIVTDVSALGPAGGAAQVFTVGHRSQ